MTRRELRQQVADRMGYMPGSVMFWSELHDWQKREVKEKFFMHEDNGDSYAYGVTIQGHNLCRNKLTAMEFFHQQGS